jgi:HK97 gp10 family phage protein
MKYEWKGDKVMAAVDKAITKALLTAAQAVESQAVDLAPVAREGGGNLKSSITHKVQGDTARVGTNVEYAPYVEYGTGIHAEGGKGRKTPWVYRDEKGRFFKTKGMKPQPYLRPAYDANKEKIKKLIGDAVAEAAKGATR